MSQIVLELKGISKTFPGVKALNEMQLQVYAGEVHALMGENGAGKSTLMNIINGSYQKDSGEIYMDGRLVEIRSINDAAALGISMIHQELNYVPALTVADNIFLGRELVSGKWLQKQKMLEQAQKLLDEMEIHLDPASKMCDLSVSQQQMVEIIRAVSNNARVLIMDEPTSAITSEEVEVLFRIIDKLKKKDVAIIYITHKMDEVFRIADRVTVMRDGCYISSFPREQLEETSLISMMVGREIKNMFPKSNTPTTEEFFRVEHLTSGRFTDISFSLNRGEILGVAGLMGAGRTEIMRAIFGLDPLTAGTITMNGKVVAGEWADVIRFRDWLKNDMQVRVVNLFVTRPKVPYTDSGIGLVQNQMLASLKAGQDVGGIAEEEFDEDGNSIPGYTTSVPLAAASERASRRLTKCTFKARLAGAIHFAELSGSLTYEL